MKEFKIKTTLNRVKDWHYFTFRKGGKIKNENKDVLAKRENWFTDWKGDKVNCMDFGGGGFVIKSKRAVVWVESKDDIKFNPCPHCPFKAKSEKDCGICASDNDDYFLYSPCTKNSEYSASNPWNAPGMGVNNFIR